MIHVFSNKIVYISVSQVASSFSYIILGAWGPQLQGQISLGSDCILPVLCDPNTFSIHSSPLGLFFLQDNMVIKIYIFLAQAVIKNIIDWMT